MTTSYTAAQILSSAPQGSADILDSAADIQADLDALEPLAAAGKIAAIGLTDTGFAVLGLTPAQLQADLPVLKDINGTYAITIDGAAANIAAIGVGGIGTTVELAGAPAQYTVIGLGDGSGFIVSETGTGRTSTDHFSGITELKFGNGGMPIAAFVASETPSFPGAVPSAQIAALYAAVLARTPDSAGLAYYEAEAANPANTILCLAAQFLSSPEYAGNPAHTYAQTEAGEAQFVTDSYANLLHRAPEAGAVQWYETHDIDPWLAGQTPGTAAYAAADQSAHALMLAHFSLSPEFMADVSVNAQHPASETRWLIQI